MLHLGVMFCFVWFFTSLPAHRWTIQRLMLSVQLVTGIIIKNVVQDSARADSSKRLMAAQGWRSYYVEQPYVPLIRNSLNSSQ